MIVYSERNIKMGYYYTVAEYKIPFLSFLSKKIKNINGILNLKNHFLHQSNVKKKICCTFG